MIPALALIFMMSGAGAFTLNPLSCMQALSSRMDASRESSEKNFDQVLEALRARGANELLAPVRENRIQVQFQAFRFLGQSPVSGRRPWFGKPVLKIRGFQFSNEKEKQELVWLTAVSIFELQARDKLWSLRAMLTPDDQRQFDLSMAGSDENVDYFLREMPKEWRDLQLKRLETLESEMYAVFSTLNLLDAQDLLPKNDPGRFWKLKALYGGDASQSIAPNQEDFDKWKQGSLAGMLEQRHGRSLLFNYYMNFVKRALVVTMAAQLASFAPQVAQIPSYLEAFNSMSQTSQQISDSPAKAQELRQSYQENLRKQVIREEARLKKEILKQKTSARPDGEWIASLEAELKDLYESYAWLRSP